MHLLSKNYFVN